MFVFLTFQMQGQKQNLTYNIILLTSPVLGPQESLKYFKDEWMSKWIETSSLDNKLGLWETVTHIKKCSRDQECGD